ncbi:hypothetical protein [Marinobacter sp.]|uniref:hypothetical protein n=1 Tax=Marinobacter sp. TaxID=50741 RepID=UPI003A9430C4
MSNPTYKQFFYRVGGASLLFFVVIQLSQKYAPEYTGIAVLSVCALCIGFAAYSESKGKKKLRAKKRQRRKR